MDAQKIIDKAIQEAMTIIDEECMKTLSYLGEQCVKLSRERPMSESWNDQTGNLRSSIGFAVARQGAVEQMSSFEAVKGPKGDGSGGVSEGKRVAEQKAQATTAPYALVVVAGMEYASHVEAKGRDVLASAEAHARSKIGEYLQKTQEKINKRFEGI